MKFLQINMQRSRAAQDLALQTARERGIDVLFFSEQYKKPDPSNSWFQDASARAGILVCNPAMTVSKFLEADMGFVWVEIADLRLYSCYFSPNDPFPIFADQVDALESSIRQSNLDAIITGDFNAKSPEWGETRLDKRGKLVCEMLSGNNLFVANQGKKWTFRRGVIGSILDLTITTSRIGRKINCWEVLEEETLSDHQYIQFFMEQGSPLRPRKQANRQRRPSWNTRKLDKEKLSQFLTEARLIDEMGWGTRPQTWEQEVRATRKTISAACDAAMPRRNPNGPGVKSVYWWSEELASLRKHCLAARRSYTRSKGNLQLQAAWNEARSTFKKAIKASKLRCWRDLIGEVENDPWGLAFKIVTKKLRTRRQTPGLDRPSWVKQIIRALFPPAEPWTRRDWRAYHPKDEELFTLSELKEAAGRLKPGKAPGIDGIPNEILKETVTVYPGILLRCLNACFLNGEFFSDWKRQKLVLLRKGDKPLEEVSSYRPICLLDTMGKLLEDMVLQRLQNHLTGENSLSGKQFGFRKGRSTVDAIQAVVALAEKAKKGSGKKKGFCALVAIDIRNAFNTARWPMIMESLRERSVPGHLLRIVDNYLSDRWVIYEGQDFILREEMKCGAPQGSRIGPLLWNAMYDNFIEMDLPESTEIIGFADDALIVCAADDVRILELRINESLRRAKRWLDSRGLKMALEKTEALLVTDRRSFERPVLRIGEFEVEWRKQIKYLGVVLDKKLNFRPHIHQAGLKAVECGANLARMMPNVGGPREEKRRLVACVAHSKLLYAAPVWAPSLTNQAISQRLMSSQRAIALRIISAYRTVSTSAALVLARVPPADLQAMEREEIFRSGRAQGPTRAGEEGPFNLDLRKEARQRLTGIWQARWNREESGRWTHRLIPDLGRWCERKHGVVSFYVTQALTGHGCFNSYLQRFKKRERGACDYCESLEDDAEHTLFICPKWDEQRRVMFSEVGVTVSPENMISLMTQSEQSWARIEAFLTFVMKAKASDGQR